MTTDQTLADALPCPDCYELWGERPPLRFCCPKCRQQVNSSRLNPTAPATDDAQVSNQFATDDALVDRISWATGQFHDATRWGSEDAPVGKGSLLDWVLHSQAPLLAQLAELKAALTVLERKATEVSRLGACTGPQWVALTGALIAARATLRNAL